VSARPSVAPFLLDPALNALEVRAACPAASAGNLIGDLGDSEVHVA
jgi:hypothetical protein